MKSNGQSGGARERIFQGLAVGAGVAIGVVHRHDSRSAVQVRERHIPSNKVRAEQQRVVDAAAAATKRMEDLQAEARRMAGPAGKESGQSKPDVYLIEIKDGKVIVPAL